MLASQRSSSMSRPIWVSLTETLTSTPAACHSIQHREVLVPRGDGLRFGRHALAQQVERRRDAPLAELVRHPDRLLDRFARHEPRSELPGQAVASHKVEDFLLLREPEGHVHRTPSRTGGPPVYGSRCRDIHGVSRAFRHKPPPGSQVYFTPRSTFLRPPPDPAEWNERGCEDRTQRRRGGVVRLLRHQLKPAQRPDSCSAGCVATDQVGDLPEQVTPRQDDQDDEPPLGQPFIITAY